MSKFNLKKDLGRKGVEGVRVNSKFVIGWNFNI